MQYFCLQSLFIIELPFCFDVSSSINIDKRDVAQCNAY